MTGSFEDLFRSVERDPEFLAASLALAFTAEVVRCMEERPSPMSRADLARAVGAKESAISRALRGDANLTIRSLAKLALGVGAEVRLHLAPLGSETYRYLDLHSGGPKVPPERVGGSADRESTPTHWRKAQMPGAEEREANVDADLREGLG